MFRLSARVPPFSKGRAAQQGHVRDFDMRGGPGHLTLRTRLGLLRRAHRVFHVSHSVLWHQANAVLLHAHVHHYLFVVLGLRFCVNWHCDIALALG